MMQKNIIKNNNFYTIKIILMTTLPTPVYMNTTFISV